MKIDDDFHQKAIVVCIDELASRPLSVMVRLGSTSDCILDSYNTYTSDCVCLLLFSETEIKDKN